MPAYLKFIHSHFITNPQKLRRLSSLDKLLLASPITESVYTSKLRLRPRGLWLFSLCFQRLSYL